MRRVAFVLIYLFCLGDSSRKHLRESNKELQEGEESYSPNEFPLSHSLIEVNRSQADKVKGEFVPLPAHPVAAQPLGMERQMGPQIPVHRLPAIHSRPQTQARMMGSRLDDDFEWEGVGLVDTPHEEEKVGTDEVEPQSMRTAKLPRAIVFDLDGCVWCPDMYMLWGGGAPFDVRDDGTLSDRSGNTVRLLGATSQILHELHTDPKWKGCTVCIASCTDEPNWAQECLRKFSVGPPGGGLAMKQCFQIEEIHKGSKRSHLRSISELTGVPLEEMLFFDNELGNCNDVASIGVTVAYVPDGVTAAAWERALELYPAPGEIL